MKTQIKEQTETIQIGKYQLTKLKVVNRKEDIHENTIDEKFVDCGNMKENTSPLLTENVDKCKKCEIDDRRNSKFSCPKVENDSKVLEEFHNDSLAMTCPVKELKSKIIPEDQVHEEIKPQKRLRAILPQRKEIDFSKYMSKELSKREAINSNDSSLTLLNVKVVGVNPIADSKSIDVNPIASSKIIDVNPTASSKIIHVKPVVDPIVIHPSDFFRSLKRQKLQNFN